MKPARLIATNISKIDFIFFYELQNLISLWRIEKLFEIFDTMIIIASDWFS